MGFDFELARPGLSSKMWKWEHQAARFLLFHAQDPAMMNPMYAALHAAPEFKRAFDMGFSPDAPYRVIALVDAPTLERVFDMTNHGAMQTAEPIRSWGPGLYDRDMETEIPPWTAGPGVKHLRPGHGERSTSVGDIVFDSKMLGCAVVASIGWARINPNGTLGELLTREEMTQ